jgi:hypothetical protein
MKNVREVVCPKSLGIAVLDKNQHFVKRTESLGLTAETEGHAFLQNVLAKHERKTWQNCLARRMASAKSGELRADPSQISGV